MKLLSEPWLSDGSTIISSSYWGSTEAIISVDVLRYLILNLFSLHEFFFIYSVV